MTGQEIEPEEQALAQSMVGRTITRVRWFDASPDQDWTGHEEAWLFLDDGRVIEFGAWGHDAWGATINEIRVVDVPECLHCGKEHLNARVCEGWNYPDDQLTRITHGHPFAWCTDGNHAALVLEGKAGNK